MREIWRGGLDLVRNDFGCCVALAGADNFVQKIKNRAICCEALILSSLIAISGLFLAKIACFLKQIRY